jgi:four helix bundle protein
MRDFDSRCIGSIALVSTRKVTVVRKRSTHQPTPPHHVPDKPEQKIRTHRDLVAWQYAIDVAIASHRLALKLPQEDQYVLGEGLMRAAIAVPSHIAQGFSSGDRTEYVRHLWIANGKLKRLESYVLIAQDVGLVTDIDADTVLCAAELVGKVLRRLRIAVTRSPKARVAESNGGAVNRLPSGS